MAVERPETAANDVAARWRTDVFEPGMVRRRPPSATSPTRSRPTATCRGPLALSERAGRDIGEEAALAALAAREAPSESAAQMVVAETATASFPSVGR